MKSSRSTQGPFFLPRVVLVAAFAAPACSSSRQDPAFESFSWENKCSGPGLQCYYKTVVEAEGLVIDTVNSSVATFVLEPEALARLKADFTSDQTIALFRQGCHAVVSGDQITATLKLVGQSAMPIEWVCPYDETVKMVETWVGALEHRGHPDGGAQDTAQGDLRASDVASEGDADAPSEPACALRGEVIYSANAGCYAIRGILFAQVCQGRRTPTFAGCVPGGPDGGAAVTWGQQDGSGQIFQFGTTQMPAGWSRSAQPACPWDGEADSLDDTDMVDVGMSKTT